MGWLEDLTKPMVGRVWQAFAGFGHTMDAHICTSPHVFVAIGPTIVSPTEVAPHLHVDLRVWSRGGPDRTIISWQPKVAENCSVDKQPTGPLVLERSGKPVTIDLILRFEKMPFKVGDTFAMTLQLNNGVPKHVRTKVT